MLTAAALCWHAASAQIQPGPKHPPGIEKLVDWARAVPVEYRADVLFRLIDAGQIGDRSWIREILEDLFATAPQAQYPVASFDVGTTTDTRSWALASGLGLQLDTLSIRCRVVKKMLALDPGRARELFAGTAEPPAAHPGCVDTLAPNPGIWYETAQELADRSFLAAERGRGESMQFFEPCVRSIASSLQLPAAARAIRVIKASPEERQKLVDILASRMAELADGDRSFSFALHRLNLPDEIVQLGEECKKQGVSADSLVLAYRAFLVQHFTGERCADTLAPQRTAGVNIRGAGPDDAILKFNQRLRWAGYLASVDLKPIAEDESRPAKLEGKPNIVNYWRTPQSKHLLSTIKHLRFGDAGQSLTTEQKQIVEWQNEVRQFLADLASWNAQDELSPADYFHERAILCRALIDLIPSGALRDSVVQSYVAFLSQNPMEAESPIQFLPHLNALFQLAHPPAVRPEGEQVSGLRVENSEAILDALRNSKDSVIALYANLEKIAPLANH